MTPYIYVLYGICILIIGLAIGYAVTRYSYSIPLPLSSDVTLMVTVPETHADIVREAMAKAGAGKVGNYANCSFSFKGIGRFMPLEGAHPAIGQVGKLESVEEETIQMPCPIKNLKAVITAIKQVHPYEEPGIDIMPLYYFDHSHIKNEYQRPR